MTRYLASTCAHYHIYFFPAKLSHQLHHQAAITFCTTLTTETLIASSHIPLRQETIPSSSHFSCHDFNIRHDRLRHPLHVSASLPSITIPVSAHHLRILRRQRGTSSPGRARNQTHSVPCRRRFPYGPCQPTAVSRFVGQERALVSLLNPTMDHGKHEKDPLCTSPASSFDLQA